MSDIMTVMLIDVTSDVMTVMLIDVTWPGNKHKQVEPGKTCWWHWREVRKVEGWGGNTGAGWEELRVSKKCWELGIISGIGSNDHQKAEIHPSPLSPEWSMIAAVMTLFKPSLPYSRTYCMQQRSLASLSVIHRRFQNLSPRHPSISPPQI